jgi:UDP-glucose 4-epimerase
MKNRRVVIAGGAGFIGSNLVHELASNNNVIIIDDLSTGRMENIAGLVDRENVTVLRASILDLKLLIDVFHGIDFVFHLAAVPSVARSINDPILVNEVNITGTLNVLIASRNNRVKEEPRAGDIRDSLADISKARAIGYHPRYDLEEGLRETIKRYTNAG